MVLFVLCIKIISILFLLKFYKIFDYKILIMFKRCLGDCHQIRNISDFYNGRNKCKSCYKKSDVSNAELARYMNELLTELRDDLIKYIDKKFEEQHNITIESSDSIKKCVINYQSTILVDINNILRKTTELDSMILRTQNMIKQPNNLFIRSISPEIRDRTYKYLSQDF